MNPIIASHKAVSGSKRGRLSVMLAVLILLAGLWMPPQPALASGTPAITNTIPPAAAPLQEPTVVWVAAFQAESQPDGSVRLSWMTGIEVDMLGFNIYRVDPTAGRSGPVKSAIIFTTQSGEMIGDSYTFLDTHAEPGAAGDYWLEVIRGTSQPLIYGPAEKITPVNKNYLPVLFSTAH